MFPHQQNKIGEVWFDAGPEFSLLTKFIFTSAKLSVQVHPDDAYAKVVENSRGKSEMWHILSAEPDSTVALGFRKPVTQEQLRASIADGSVEELLNWVPVKAGDTYYAAAGTVHAIGAGISLCEIQQNSDVTYRLYDYGRPRELHLEKGLAVANTTPYEGRRDLPVRCDYFITELVEIATAAKREIAGDGVLIVLEGSGSLAGFKVNAGDVCLVTAESKSVDVVPGRPMRLLHAMCGPRMSAEA